MAGVSRKQAQSGFTLLRSNIRVMPGRKTGTQPHVQHNDRAARERYQHLLEALDLMENWTAYMSDE